MAGCPNEILKAFDYIKHASLLFLKHKSVIASNIAITTGTMISMVADNLKADVENQIMVFMICIWKHFTRFVKCSN